MIWVEAIAGPTRVVGFADLDSPAANGFAHVVDNLVAVDVAAIAAAVTEAGVTLTSENVAAISLAVFRRLTGSSVALLAGPTSAELDAIHSADFDETFDVETTIGATLVFVLKRDVADETAVVEITAADGLQRLNGAAAQFAADGAISRLSATQCRVTIRARSLIEVAPGAYVGEFREIVGTATRSKHEIAINLRRSASRRVA